MVRRGDKLQSFRQSESAKRTNAVWLRPPETYSLKLQSGLRVKLRKTRLAEITAEAGPARDMLEILKAARAQRGGRLTAADIPDIGGDFGALLDQILKQVMLEPKLGDVADDAHLTIAEISLDEKMTILESIPD
jgi:hypothetical protein